MNRRLANAVELIAPTDQHPGGLFRGNTWDRDRGGNVVVLTENADERSTTLYVDGHEVWIDDDAIQHIKALIEAYETVKTDRLRSSRRAAA